MAEKNLMSNSLQESYDSLLKSAYLFAGSNHTDKAIETFKKVVELDPASLSAEAQSQLQYAQAYLKIDEALKQDQLEPAIELIGKVLKFRPDDPMARCLLAALNEKVESLPASVQTYQALGDAFFKNNMADKARDMFTKISDIDPNNPAVRVHMAQLYLKQGALNEAKKEFLNLAEEFFAKGNLDQALELAQKAIELKSVEARYISGSVYFKKAKYEEAVTEFEALLRFKVNHLGALVQLGKSLDMLGRLEKATATFQKALQVDNENFEVQEAWIEYCVRIKDIDKAIPNMKAILEKAVTGNNADRVARFSKLMLLLEPDNVNTHVKLIEALESLGDKDGASEALYKYAILLERKKHVPEAIQCLEKALVLSSANAHTIEKALIRLGVGEAHKNAAKASSEDGISLKVSDLWGDVELPTPPPAAPSSADASQAQAFSGMSPLPLVDMCVQSGYLKAAIEICQQVLESNPGAEDVRKKLADVSAIYLKKLTGTK
jgi:tetratricopeptide (TPR) repeat protein